MYFSQQLNISIALSQYYLYTRTDFIQYLFSIQRDVHGELTFEDHVGRLVEEVEVETCGVHQNLLGLYLMERYHHVPYHTGGYKLPVSLFFHIAWVGFEPTHQGYGTCCQLYQGQN